jgi:hypothetical protein
MMLNWRRMLIPSLRLGGWKCRVPTCAHVRLDSKERGSKRSYRQASGEGTRGGKVRLVVDGVCGSRRAGTILGLQ